jgi:hypothetical protein
MLKTTFRAWLNSQTDRQDPVGDFARDTFREPTSRKTSYLSIRREAKTRFRACSAALEACDEAYREFAAGQENI